MAIENFDGTFGRCASVVTIVQTIPTIGTFVVLFSRDKVSLPEMLWYSLGIVILTAIILSLIHGALTVYRKSQLDSASKRASQFDYKYCADINAAGIHDFLCNKEKCDINLDVLSENDPVLRLFSSSDARYCSATEFYSNAEIMSDFECRPLKNEDKGDKCILQVLYIPIDADGKVPVILRMPDQHSSASEDKPRFTFVSFSPVPRRYGAKFDVEDCYRREVPSIPSRIDEYGMALSKKMLHDENKKGAIYYLFYIFFARYDNLHFAKDGEMDNVTLKKVFSVENDKMFAKDHDEILHVTTFANLYQAVNHRRCGDAFLIKLMSQKKRKFVRVEDGKPYISFKFDLSKAQFKGVEEKIVELEGCRNS